jgi:hypothetical protein
MSTVFDAQVMDSGIGNAIRRIDDVLEQMREFWSRDYRFGASSMIGMMHVQEIRTHLDGLWYSADLFKWDDVASISESLYQVMIGCIDDISLEIDINSTETGDLRESDAQFLLDARRLAEEIKNRGYRYHTHVFEMLEREFEEYVDECDCDDECSCQFYERIDWDMVAEDTEEVPLCIYAVCPRYAPYDRPSLCIMENREAVAILGYLDEYSYGAGSLEDQILRGKVLGYSAIDEQLVASTDLSRSDWKWISDKNISLVSNLGFIRRWKHQLDWTGEALNSYLTTEMMIEFSDLIDRKSILRYNRNLSLKDIMTGVWEVDELEIIMRFQPVNMEMLMEIETVLPLEKFWVLQNNSHLTPEMAYRYKEVMFTIKAGELRDRYISRATLYAMEHVPQPIGKMISDYLGY